LIDAAADDKEINRILGELSSGKQAILYSALHYTEPSLHSPGSAEQQPRNRSYALQMLREFLLWGFMTDQPSDTAKARAEAAFDLPASATAPDAMAEYRAKQAAERAKMARLRAMRLAAEAKAGVQSKKGKGRTGSEG
jgi:hypothetical protein